VNDGLQSEIGGRRNSHWAIAAHDLADAVRTGRYSPDERLPTLVSLATANEVHSRTMSRALRRLRELGYVAYRRGYGYFVSHTLPGCELPGSGAAVLR
jgi:DNA-binding GntR family transcriptional regulator